MHGAVDRFRLRVPAGFDVTEVKTPLLSRWGLEPVAKDANPAAGAVLEIQLREPATSAEPVTVQLVAARPGRPPEAWTFPAIEPLDTAAHVAVWGLLAEDRWKVDGIETTGLLPIDATTLAKALPASVQTADPTAPPVLALAAFYAPQAGSSWTARLRQPAASFRTTANVLLLVGQKQ